MDSKIGEPQTKIISTIDTHKKHKSNPNMKLNIVSKSQQKTTKEGKRKRKKKKRPRVTIQMERLREMFNKELEDVKKWQ